MRTYEDFLDNPPRVFISYSWSDEDHQDRVLKLANQLLNNGVDVKIDKWDLREGQDKYEFMEQMVNDENIEKVLILCDKTYKEKANIRKGGVGDETQIISSEIYNDTKQTKFIPIIFERDENGDPFLPTYIKNRIYIDLSDEAKYDEGYENLIRAIYNRPENIKQPLGAPPSYIFEEKALMLTKTYTTKRRFKRALKSGKPVVIGIFEEYLFELASIVENDFILEKSQTDKPFDDKVIEKINEFLPYRDELIDILNEIIKYQTDIQPFFILIHKLFEKLITLSHPESNSIIWDQIRFITWELFLYINALLINRRYLDVFDSLVRSKYLISDEYNTKLYTYKIIYHELPSINNNRNKRLHLGRKSIVFDEMRNRKNNIVTFNLVRQADLILFFRSCKLKGTYGYWPPVMLLTARDAYSDNLEFFIRSEELEEFQILLKFIDHNDKNDLIETISRCKLEGTSYFGPFFSIVELTNLENIGTN